MTDGKDTAVKTKPFISKENAQNRPETIQRETVLGVSAFREQISNSAAKRRCPLCPVCRNTSRENGRSFLMSVAGRNTTSFLYSMLPEGIEKTMHPLKSRTAPPSKSKLYPLDGWKHHWNLNPQVQFQWCFNYKIICLCGFSRSHFFFFIWTKNS